MRPLFRMIMVIFFSLPAQLNATELHLIVPNWVQQDQAFLNLTKEFHNQTGSNLILEAIPMDVAAAKVRSELVAGAPVDILFGWPADSDPISQLEGENPKLVPNWIERDAEKFSALDNPFAGRLTILGAGWKIGDPNSTLIYSLPAGIQPKEFPLIVARPIERNSANSNSQDLLEAFFRILRESDYGRTFIETNTGIPALQNSTSPGVKLLVRPYNADRGDGCGCESASATCNPDGISASEFSFDRIIGDRYDAWNWVDASSNDDDGCGCDNRSTIRYERSSTDRNLKLEKEQLSGDMHSIWSEHFQYLETENSKGSIIFIQSCNPD